MTCDMNRFNDGFVCKHFEASRPSGNQWLSHSAALPCMFLAVHSRSCKVLARPREKCTTFEVYLSIYVRSFCR